MNNAKLELITYESKYAPAFKRLNQEWIVRYFEMEEIDELVLSNPEQFIIDRGGQIFFAQYGEEIVGVCAMIPEGENTYELSKMAVTDKFKGLGIGKALMRVCVDWAKQKKASQVFLLSNTKLETAIGLYRKFGFVEEEIHAEDREKYKRGNIRMVLKLSPRTSYFDGIDHTFRV